MSGEAERKAYLNGLRDGRGLGQARPVVQSDFMRRFNIASTLIAHHTEMIKTYAEWMTRERQRLAEAGMMLEGLLQEVEAVAEDPFAQGTESRSDETGTGSAEGNGPVLAEDAPQTQDPDHG